MNARIVTRLTQRHGIAKAAGDGNIVRGRALGQVGETGAIGAQGRTVVGKRHFQLVLAGNGADASG